MTWRRAAAMSSTVSRPASSSGRSSPTSWRRSSVKARPVILCATIAAIAFGDQLAFAQQAPIAYPGAGQSLDQQAKDEADCRNIATQATGVSPYTTQPEYYSGAPSGPGAVGGAARGAALGAVGGAIGGDAGKGAAIGAAVGGTAGVLRRNRE